MDNATAFNPTNLPANMRKKIAIRHDGCWEWVGALNGNGYGVTKLTDGFCLTHRAAYESLVGSIPEGLQVDHLCRFKSCCNPAHLEAVTPKVNNERKPTTHKSHCKHGHAMDAENTIIKCRPNGLEQRNCRECERAAQRRRRAQWASLQTEKRSA